MKPEMIAIISVFALFIVLETLFTRFWKKEGQTRRDAIVEIVGTVAILLFTQPTILAITYALGLAFLPSQQDALAGLPWYLGLLLFVVLDDMMQYWYHRASHTFPWLYNLHRAHHAASYMSVRLVYRNNLFYYWLMPSIWFSGVLIYLGLGWVYAGYLIVKLTIITAAHSDVTWDAPLLRSRALSPLMWVIERTISTPATHHAHHGRHKSDGVTHYKGNYGNMFFIWDVIFGTARITRRYPDSYGIEDMPEVGAARLLAWPVLRGRASGSEATLPAE